MRAIDEWIGQTSNSRIPPRVRLRVFYRDSGICQCGCQRLIHAGEKWQTDHRIALVNGGENRESNLRTLLAKHHATKTKADVAEKSRVYRKRSSHLGIKKPRAITRWRRFDGSIREAGRER